MTCDQCREQLSARLDGEDDPLRRDAVAAHLAHCADCQRWFDDAARVTRLARTQLARPTPDFVDAVLERQPRIGRSRLRGVLRTLLLVLGFGQLALAGYPLLDTSGTGHHAAATGVNHIHLTSEFAAWNLALGVGFLWVALRDSRPIGLLPTLSAFVLVLTALEAIDLLRGDATPARMLSHSLVLAGLVVLVVLSRTHPNREINPPATHRAHPAEPTDQQFRSSWRRRRRDAA